LQAGKRIEKQAGGSMVFQLLKCELRKTISVFSDKFTDHTFPCSIHISHVYHVRTQVDDVFEQSQQLLGAGSLFFFVIYVDLSNQTANIPLSLDSFIKELHLSAVDDDGLI
jgi:hypothetical protein